MGFKRIMAKRPVEGEIIRVRLPEGKQMLGTIEELLGASRFKVMCKDGKLRMCRIPGKFRKRVNVRIGDIVIVVPWDVESDEKGDIIWIYNKTHAAWLREKGHI
jgi:translation initiation factor 1A